MLDTVRVRKHEFLLQSSELVRGDVDTSSPSRLLSGWERIIIYVLVIFLNEIAGLFSQRFNQRRILIVGVTWLGSDRLGFHSQD